MDVDSFEGDDMGGRIKVVSLKALALVPYCLFAFFLAGVGVFVLVSNFIFLKWVVEWILG